MEIDNITNGRSWIQPSGELFHLTCCDCGSTHAYKISVENGEELSVQVFTADKTTKEMRRDHWFNYRYYGESLGSLLKLVLEGKKKKALKLAQEIQKDREGELQSHEISAS